MKPRNYSFFEILEEFPPPAVRIYGKRPGGGRGATALSDAEVAIASGIPLSRVREISLYENWDAVSVSEMKALFHVLNFNPTLAAHRNRVAMYARTCKKRKCPVFQYLTSHPKFATEFLPLTRLLKQIESRKKSSQASGPTPSPALTSAA